MSDSTSTIVWFRDDLRVSDNPALSAASSLGLPVVAVYIASEERARSNTQGARALGGASKWWLHHSLESLAGSLEGLGIPLLVGRGDACELIPQAAQALKASAVHWNRRYTPPEVSIDKELKAALKSHEGLEVCSHKANLLFEPWEVKTQQGDDYSVFTPFWRACLKRTERVGEVCEVPEKSQHPRSPLDGCKLPSSIQVYSKEVLNALGLLPTTPDWAGGLRDTWEPGEKGAEKRLTTFLQSDLERYSEDRDKPGCQGTSMLSPHLRFGEISPRTVWHRVHDLLPGASKDFQKNAHKFLSELGWREFSYQLLFANPGLPNEPLKPEFSAMPWLDDDSGFDAWTRGQTGYPIVDAGMRELWTTGYMHNRVRMIAASFLIKHLMIHWKKGESWFWDTLVDADPANNTASWQWVAGSGADAAPYFRIFNPTLQAERFDKEGVYARRWVPEIAQLPNKWIYKPWEAPHDVLEDAGVTLGKTYPKPIVEHGHARQRALASYEVVKQAKT